MAGQQVPFWQGLLEVHKGARRGKVWAARSLCSASQSLHVLPSERSQRQFQRVNPICLELSQYKIL